MAKVILKMRFGVFVSFSGVVAAVFFMCVLIFKARIIDINTEAIVMNNRVSAAFEPTEGATVHFHLYEGDKVRIVSQRGQWDKIQRKDGKTGWVRREKISKI